MNAADKKAIETFTHFLKVAKEQGFEVLLEKGKMYFLGADVARKKRKKVKKK